MKSNRTFAAHPCGDYNFLIMRQFFVILLFSSSFFTTVFAQISDDFSDGNFTTMPVWEGDVANFVVNSSSELQLNAPEAGNSLLMVQTNIADSTIWNFKVRMAFAPSTSNLLRIWLQAAALSTTADGYYLEIGENGSADALRFYRIQGGVPQLLATGLAGAVGTDPVDVRIRVKRSAGGAWTADLAQGTGAFSNQFVVTDAVIPGGAGLWCGFYCLYSATRTDKFFFDDISVLPDLPDTQAPVMLSATPIDNQHIQVSFDEPLDEITAEQPARYSINGNITPQEVIWSAVTPSHVQLVLAQPLSNGQTYTVTTNQLKDLLGNVSGEQTTSFQLLVAEVAVPSDILINEIMADPSPSVGLPATAEWVELYNKSTKYIQLSTLRINDAGGLPKSLPNYLLAPQAIIVLCTSAAAIELASVPGTVLAVAEFPSLNNESETITLTNTQGTVIDQVAFTLNWHQDALKRDGGWSLERINPDLTCLGAANWQSCPLPPGGTPGLPNLSLSTAPDITAPVVENSTLVNAQTIQIRFTEGMDVDAAENVANYTLSPSVSILSSSASTDRTTVTLTLGAALQASVLYSLVFKSGLTDCSGNSVDITDTIVLGIPEAPQKGDIVVNEILFNPASGGSRFVEFYNQSARIFNWKDFFIVNYANGTDVEAIGQDRLFLPGEIVVFTPSPTDITTRFEQVAARNVIQQILPSLDDKKGNIALYWSANGQSVTVDSFDYVSTYHNPLLSTSDQEGVSLERIRPEGPTNSGWNWTSAANQGTPTRVNGQRGQGTPIAGDLITLSAARVSPDGDGYEDYLDIVYQLPASGYAATMTIYDAEGTVVKKVLRQELAGATGAIRWDGDTDSGSLARPGIHILYMEIFEATGQVQEVKIPFAVVTRF